ncbi:Transposon TX1 uncharacterized 149 kDa protein [Vitis vinifera]|uniref:Transposon TX1 uncharacterized 149 kDa protein n=1 Tax=Vitis vinifera TaxID=29760 RepID=A0A438HBA9_VITVI|nr:Transposon TX1 uncharacterized 149 kDa protein [Vitis vinifera]
MWLKVEGFKDIVRTWWQGIEVKGSASYRLAVKMKEIKKKLKVWNKEVFGRLEVNKVSALQQVDFWDRVESERNLTVEEAELKKEAKDSFKKWVLLEEAHWRQHSREIWLREGNRNTGFFHRMASAHRRNNALDKIKVNGEWLVEEQEVKEEVVNSFQQMLSEDMDWKADIGRIQMDYISRQEAESLEIPFTENEIYSVLMEMSGDKAPGPDGFTVAFWQNAWDFIKEEILEMFKEFHEHNSFVRSLNNTFLVLIPKKSGAEDLGDFRPISLLGGLYKLLAKVLANRLKKVIGKVVSIAQNAFVMGRQILDASLIANERASLRGSSIPLSLCYGNGSSGRPHQESGGGGYLSGCIIRGAASGLRINLAKSEIIPIGEVEEILELAVELGKKQGGLGLRKIATLNRALLGKWIWRFACEKDNLWKQVITTKYGQEDHGWRSKKASGAAGVGVWKEILKESEWCWENLAFLVGKGDVGPRFGQGDWNLVFVRDFNDWELDMVGDLLHTLRGHRPSLEEDSVMWRQGRNGLFRVKEAYRLLDKPNATVFPSRSIWVDRVSTKVCFFA